MQIGTKTWFKGDEVTITTEPYIMHGGEFQDAVRDDGKVVCIVTEAQRDNDVKRNQANWKKQQKQFANLHK